ncbi:MAG: NUDIX hydrolase [Halodesulfurarchaeum sp.]
MTDPVERPGGNRPDSGPEWPVSESVTEYETGWYTGGYDRVEQPDGSEKRYYWAELPPAVVIVAIEADAVLFVEQYRPTIREHCLELPAGIVEAREDYEAAARRELEEETGRVPETTRLLQRFDVATGVLRHERGIVLATDLTEGTRRLDDNEFLTIRRVPTEEAIELARAPPANDATLEGLMLAEYEGEL